VSHPYEEYEGTRLWAAIADEIEALEKNHDLTLSTAPEYVVGSLCRRLIQVGCAHAETP
jgi:hypothetical protein